MSIILCALFLLMQLADGVLTTYGVIHGVPESNPLMATVARNWWFALAKVSIFIPSLVAAYILAKIFLKKRPWVAKAVNVTLICLIVIYAGVVANNIYYVV